MSSHHGNARLVASETLYRLCFANPAGLNRKRVFPKRKLQETRDQQLRAGEFRHSHSQFRAKVQNVQLVESRFVLRRLVAVTRRS
jgi:hypothetical protein